MADEHEAESANAEGRDNGDVAKRGAKGDENARDDKRKSGMDPAIRSLTSKKKKKKKKNVIVDFEY